MKSLISKKENNDLGNELKNSFPFVETIDQKKAIKDVFFDSSSHRKLLQQPSIVDASTVSEM